MTSSCKLAGHENRLKVRTQVPGARSRALRSRPLVQAALAHWRDAGTGDQGALAHWRGFSVAPLQHGARPAPCTRPAPAFSTARRGVGGWAGGWVEGAWTYPLSFRGEVGGESGKTFFSPPPPPPTTTTPTPSPFLSLSLSRLSVFLPLPLCPCPCLSLSRSPPALPLFRPCSKTESPHGPPSSRRCRRRLSRPQVRLVSRSQKRNKRRRRLACLGHKYVLCLGRVSQEAPTPLVSVPGAPCRRPQSRGCSRTSNGVGGASGVSVAAPCSCNSPLPSFPRSPFAPPCLPPSFSSLPPSLPLSLSHSLPPHTLSPSPSLFRGST